MASKIGICPNAAGCTLAYAKQPVTVAEGAEFHCPECGQTLLEGKEAAVGGRTKLPPWVIAAAVVGVLLLAAALVFVPKLLSGSSSSTVAAGNETLSPAEKSPTSEPTTVKSEPLPTPVTPVAATMPAPVVTPPQTSSPSNPATPMATEQRPGGTSEPPVDTPATPATTLTPLVENKEESAEVKKQVLARIDTMPNLPPTTRTKLYTAVDRARGMYKMAIISFDSGKVAPSASAVSLLLDGMRSPGVQRLISDPTTVLIILGYADAKGDDRKNLQVSTDRAESLSKALRDQGKILNVMHAVGMGGSEMFSKQQREKNRVVEIWAVLP